MRYLVNSEWRNPAAGGQQIEDTRLSNPVLPGQSAARAFCAEQCELEHRCEGRPPLVSGIDVHWCYPFFNGAPCDDVRRPWKRACVGLLHEWDAACEKRKACIQCRQPDQSTSREWSFVPSEALLEMGVQMTPTTHALAAPSKEKLAAYSATWATALAKKAS